MILYKQTRHLHFSIILAQDENMMLWIVNSNVSGISKSFCSVYGKVLICIEYYSVTPIILIIHIIYKRNALTGGRLI